MMYRPWPVPEITPFCVCPCHVKQGAWNHRAEPGGRYCGECLEEFTESLMDFLGEWA